MIYVAAALIVIGVVLFVAAPLSGGLMARRRVAARRDADEIDRLEHDKGLAMQGLRELEFDRETGKLTEADYTALRESLMARAIDASAALERLSATPTGTASAPGRPRLVKSATAAAAPPNPRFCPQCGAKAVPGNFCRECGAPLSEKVRAAARADR